MTKRIAPAVLAIVLLVATAAPAQYTGSTLGGAYPGGDYPGGGGYPDGGTGTGKVKLKLTAKKKQKSLKAVKVKASCANRACMLDVKGKLKAGKKKAKLKPADESLAAGETSKLKLKLSKKAKKVAKKAVRADRKLVAKISATAKGVGGGGEDKASVKVRLKPKR